jgi:preprotein translocase subunit SecE
MKKSKVKVKGAAKEAAPGAAGGKLVKLRPGKPRISWTAKLPPIKSYWAGTRQFLVEAVQELKKVVWPGRKETLGTTAVVLLLVIIISIFLGLVDMGLSRLVRQIMH